MIVGLDPGQRGALVVLGRHRRVLLALAADDPARGYCLDGEVHPDTLASAIRDCMEAHPLDLPLSAAVEVPTVQPPTGRSSCLTIGVNYGVILGTLAMMQVPVHRVTGPVWSRAVLGAPPAGGWHGAAKKHAAMAAAMRALPGLDLVVPGRRSRHDGIGDAACIAIYADDRWGRE